MRFEYKEARLSAIGRTKLVAELNQYGQHGWEVVETRQAREHQGEIGTTGSWVIVTYVLFKRRITGPPQVAQATEAGGGFPPIGKQVTIKEGAGDGKNGRQVTRPPRRGENWDVEPVGVHDEEVGVCLGREGLKVWVYLPDAAQPAPVLVDVNDLEWDD
jgi:hypothetical protein